MKREYPKQPVVGVGLLIKGNNKIVLVKRDRDPARRLWSIPGGLLELGEKICDGANREAMEETGLEVEIESLLDVGDSITYNENGKIRFHYVLVNFLGHPIGGNLKPATDVSEACWVSLDEVSKFSIIKTLKRLLAKISYTYI